MKIESLDIKHPDSVVKQSKKEIVLFVSSPVFEIVMWYLVAEYMTLPVSQYSVLDAAKIERISDETFRVQIGEVSFLGTKVIPIMTLTVKPHDTGCEVTLLECLVRVIQFQRCCDVTFMRSVS